VAFALSPPACMLCGRAAADPDICGHKIQQQGLCAHVFCLVSAPGQCFVCGKSGAATTCRQEGCDRSFHLPCAAEGGCVTQFFFQYRSFCGEHSPEQAVEAAPEKDTTCLLCLDVVGDRKSYGTMVCPACKHAWFHRGCIQGQAVRDGISCFRCPLCRDRDAFSSEMLSMGIRIPFRLVSCPAHQTGEQELCWTIPCCGPHSHEPVCFPRPWQLLLCCSCAAEGTHRRCSHLRTSTASWECDSCAGLGTGKRQSTRGFSPRPSLSFSPRPFCGEHSPEQAAEVAPEEEHRLPHLPGPCWGQKSYGTMVCPACKHAWFHRGCIQVGAAPSPPGHGRRSAAPGPHSCSLCFCCRDRLCAMASASSARSVETGVHFSWTC
uniref:RING-type domain-containing protein n=1 Tax=Strix occidentalis caurina TaxID=311401 RepID=A0A8D0FLS2_STROC